MNIHLLVALLIVAAILGDACNYQIGRHAGARLFANPDSRIFRREYLTRTEAFYARHGGKTIVLARFVPIVRTFAPFVAGMGQMAYLQGAASICWAHCCGWPVSAIAGYLFGNLPAVKSNLSLLILGIIVVSILPGVIEVWRQRRASA